jgi:hypothetical protein
MSKIPELLCCYNTSMFYEYSIANTAHYTLRFLSVECY